MVRREGGGGGGGVLLTKVDQFVPFFSFGLACNPLKVLRWKMSLCFSKYP